MSFFLPESNLLHLLRKLVHLGEIPRLDLLRADEDAAVGLGLEVLRALGGAVVLPRWLVQRDADPGARGRGQLGDGADEGDGAAAAVGGGGEELAARVEGDAWRKGKGFSVSGKAASSSSFSFFVWSEVEVERLFAGGSLS